MRISDWSSDVCSSDLVDLLAIFDGHVAATRDAMAQNPEWLMSDTDPLMTQAWAIMLLGRRLPALDAWRETADLYLVPAMDLPWQEDGTRLFGSDLARRQFMEVALGELERSEEHTSELQSLMRISYA